MIRTNKIVGILTAILLGAHFSYSQDAEKKAAPEGDDLHSLRLLVERQSMQIDALSEEVKRLTHLIEEKQGSVNAQPEQPQVAPVVTPASVPVAVAVVSPDGATTHVVTKGETLTSIAKHYKTTVAELLKLNKIENDRKLQIGQSLSIPSPKPAESPQDKKESQ